MSGPSRREHTRDAQCIWVAAGVLSYRICDRNFECETCELYHALRGDSAAVLPDLASAKEGHEAADTDIAGAYVRRLTAGCALQFDRTYSRGHFWMEEAPAGELLVGLGEHVVRVLYPVDDVVMPRPGVRLKRGEPCGWITRGRVSVPLTMPVSGEVRAVNKDAADALRCGGHRRDAEWLFRMAPLEDLESVPGCYRGEEAVAWYLGTMQLLRRHLAEALAPVGVGAGVGPTMADGGVVDVNLETVLGRERFERLVDELFHMHI